MSDGFGRPGDPPSNSSPDRIGKAEPHEVIAALDHGAVLIAAFAGPSFRLVCANKPFYATTSFKLGDEARERLSAMAVAALDEVYATGQSRTFRQIPFMMASGERRFLDCDLMPLGERDIDEPRVLLVGWDVTEDRANRDLLDALMRYVPTGIVIATGPDLKIARVSDFGSRLLGRPRAQLEGIPSERHPEAFGSYADLTGPLRQPDALPLSRAARTGEVVTDELHYMEDASGERIPVHCNAGPIRDLDGDVIGSVVAFHDVRQQLGLEAELRAQSSEKDLLMQELAHRVKNNLQTVSSLLTLQQRRSSNPEVRRELEIARRRIMVIADLHRHLYGGGQVDGNVDLESSLASLVVQADEMAEGRINFTLRVGTVMMPLDLATPLMLLANELISNATKHAFPDGARGNVEIGMTLDEAGAPVSFWVRDDGIGVTSSGTEKKGFGLTIADALARQTLGTLTIVADSGTLARVVWEPRNRATATGRG